ncbi:MAG: gluconate 2-dehydrogenase subunit 3 family protein [Acidobacteriaceae bacterium]|nr:gluconate 2-dehydrogenase subunit 3 family protein [Acidobacteriaceae bacterium]
MDSTRRGFLGVTVAAPALITRIQSAAETSQDDSQRTFKTVMDLIIPEADGMPSASQAGGLTYLRTLMERDKDTADDITKALTVIQAFSERSFQKPFSQLREADRISVLKDMEVTALGVFDSLRAYVYESYYTQPRIWKLIGYELYPTDDAGPHLKPLDETLVADVRNMPKLYRDV